MNDSDDDVRGEGGFFSGWSRRKLAARRQVQPPTNDDDEAAIEPLADAAHPEDAIEEEAEPEVDEAFIAALPAIEDITASTDLTLFMRRGVPVALRNAAMRKIWIANPLIRDHVDPALDYAWDWNAPGGVPGGGGTLTDSGVQQMVKDLLGDESQQPWEARRDAATEEDTASEKPDEDSAPEGDEPAPDPSSSTTKVAKNHGVDEDSPTDLRDPDNQTNGDAERSEDRVTMSLVAVRRHGGAVPE